MTVTTPPLHYLFHCGSGSRLSLTERVFEMQGFPHVTCAVERDRNDINTYETICVFRMCGEERRNGGKGAACLCANDRFRRRAMCRSCAHAHLNTDKGIGIERDEIEFAAGTVPVARDDAATVMFEEMRGNALTARANCCVTCLLRHPVARMV